MKTYTVIYRTGGRQNFQWKKALPVVTYEEAFKMEKELKTAGYHALIHDTEMLSKVGMPETYSSDDPVCIYADYEDFEDRFGGVNEIAILQSSKKAER